ncbi:purple acid phosphatase family protein [Luteimonas sp. MHLX1A]|uniref:purple acid phosphatase family protein n=1 Tax=Alterluteimonas muca TaxID=2878684 RepID=UPI001E5F69AC|nr:metallophosphoesterase family protein [Luteimonas sp. MHLX1A]MCD9046234.1 metallophosphoesterase family protein [Luteimonas sp. MHLX1A]
MIRARGIRHALAVALLAVLPLQAATQDAAPRSEPNTLVPKGVMRYAPGAFPDRIIAAPSQDAARGLGIAWRTGAGVESPWVELAVATDSPDPGAVRRVRAATQALATENGPAHHHQVHIDGLEPDTLYAWRVQGQGTWSPWRQMRTAADPGAPLTLLYFGDTQNQNASLVSRVMLEALRHAPDARLALYAGDLVSGGGGEDDNEWGEWFDAVGPVASTTAIAPTAGNHEYFKEFEDTPQERRVLGAHWPRTFVLPDNGAPGTEATTYWFDAHDARVVVLDGTSALDLGTAQAQAAWLDGVLRANTRTWTIVTIHQPMFSPRQDRDNALLREHILPVLEAHRVDLVLQGHDHVYGRRGGLTDQATPQYVVSVAGAKQYRVSPQARRDMDPVAEDTQLFQVLRMDGARLAYEARTATGRLYDAFELHREGDHTRLVEHPDARIPQRDCPRDATPKGRADRCWE